MTRRIFAALLVWLALAAACPAQSAKPATITFYHTSDIHEHSAPLARIARFVQDQKKKNPNVIFLDSGDWFNKGDLTPLNTRGEAIVDLLAACKYDAVIPGNHDFAFGYKRLAELVDKYSLPMLAANCVWPAGAAPKKAAPYRIHEFDGVKVAVIGTAPDFLGLKKSSGFKILPIAASIKPVVAKLASKADIIVLMTHLGPPEDKKLIRALPRVDIIFGGHHHKRFSKLTFDKQHETVLQHSGCFGQHIGEVVIKWNGKRIVDRKVRLIKVAPDMPESAEVKAVLKKYVRK